MHYGREYSAEIVRWLVPLNGGEPCPVVIIPSWPEKQRVVYLNKGDSERIVELP